MSEKKVEIKGVSKEADRQKARWGFVGLAAILLIVFIATMMVDRPPPPPEPETRFELSEEEGLEQRTWIVNAQAKVEQNVTEIAKLRSALQDTNKQLGQQRDVIGQINKTLAEIQRDQKRFQDRLEKGDFLSKAPPIPTTGKAPSATPPPGADYELPPRTDGTPPPPLPAGVRRPTERLPASGGASTPAERKSSGALVMRSEESEEDLPEAAADVTYVENPWAGWLPAGSHMPVVLLTGIDAGASEFNRANPAPVLLKIQDNAYLPGDARFSVNTCSLMGTAVGNLSSERVEIKLSRISCVDITNNSILEAEINGYVVDSDSTLGLSGIVERRAGALLAKAALASVLEGITEIAEAASQAATTSITSPSGGNSVQSVDINPSQLGRAAGFGGASGAAENLSEYYLTEARNIFPIVRVPGGRIGTAVIAEGGALQWAQYRGAFVQEYKPES